MRLVRRSFLNHVAVVFAIAVFACGCGRIRGGFSTEGSVSGASGAGGATAAIHGFQALHSFYPYPNGVSPAGELTLSSDGATAYGMTPYGGVNDLGIVFKVDTASGAFTRLYDFNLIDGGNPDGTLVLSAAGNFLYGLTPQGGANNNGTLFRISTSGVFLKLYDFSLSDGTSSGNSLTFSADQTILYGILMAGGIFNYGTAFSMTVNGQQFTKLHDFSVADGHNPAGSMTLSKDGNTLYGVTIHGGPGDNGTIFQMNTGGAYVKLFDFNGTNGAYPSAKLGISPSGLILYGTTVSGGLVNNSGTLFSYSLSGGVFTTLNNFNGTDGSTCSGSLTVSASGGELFGTCQYGGSANGGSIFHFDQATSVTDFHSFVGTDGQYPIGGLALSIGGVLYGMTSDGGAGQKGNIFSITTTGTQFTVLHDFEANDGASPFGSLIPSADGSVLYGMTNNGGLNDYGRIFKMTVSDHVISPLYDFNLIDGRYPRGDLVLSPDGTTLYGMTSGGGVNFKGTVFKITTAGVFTKLHDFDTNAPNPYGSLVISQDGAFLYGMAIGDNGITNYGAIFKMSSMGVIQWLHPLTQSEGNAPAGSLVLSNDGSTLYGMANSGGTNGNGTIFRVTTSSGQLTKMYDFQSVDGGLPQGSLTLSPDGLTLYGMTSSGGALNYGSIFKISTSGIFTKLHDFDYTHGAGPLGTPILSKDGTTLFGLTNGGGSNGEGSLFSMGIAGSNFVTLHDFGSADGIKPQGSLMMSSDGSMLFGMCSGLGTNNNGTIFGFGL